MAKKSGSKSAKELREEIARSREDVERRLSRVREEADLPRKIRRSVQREPVPWIVGAIALGLLVTAIVTRKQKVYVTPKRHHQIRRAACWKPVFFWALRGLLASFAKPVRGQLSRKATRQPRLARSRRTRKPFEFTRDAVRHKTVGALCPPGYIRFRTSMNISRSASRPAHRTFISV